MAPETVPPEFTGAYRPEARSQFPNAELAGSHIGPYKLLQKLGEGGMGEVWLAEQREPVERRGALKLIKAERGFAQRRGPVRGRAPGAGTNGSSQHRESPRCRDDRRRPAVLRHGTGQG